MNCASVGRRARATKRRPSARFLLACAAVADGVFGLRLDFGLDLAIALVAFLPNKRRIAVLRTTPSVFMIRLI